MGRTLASWSLDDPTTTTGGNTLSSVVVGAAALTATGAPVLLVAEPGIPTEAVARAIHHRGDRRSGPFVALDCSLMPAEVFEGKLFGGPEGEGSTAAAGALDLAERGTLFLEHLPVLGAAAQARLSAELAESPEGGGRKLRDVQLIGTTAHELGADADAVASPPQSRHRLNALPIHLPPLRHRPTDVERLARAVLTRAASRLGKTLRSLTQAEVERLLAYPWPGNESELQAVIERAATTARGERPQIRLPGDPVGDVENRRETESAGYFTESEMRARERANLVAVLQSTSWKVYGPDGAAARLGIRPTTLASRIKKLGLKEGG